MATEESYCWILNSEGFVKVTSLYSVYVAVTKWFVDDSNIELVYQKNHASPGLFINQMCLLYTPTKALLLRQVSSCQTNHSYVCYIN